MNMHNRSVAIFVGSEGAPGLVDNLRDLVGYSVQSFDTTLSQMDENAAAMAREHNVILFRTQGDDSHDIATVSAIRVSVAPDTVILALSDGATSLDQARRLIEAGVDDVLPDTISSEALVAAIARNTRFHQAANNASTVPATQGKIIAVAPARGGIGATTLATNLAHTLLGRRGFRKKQAHKTVALVDLDLQFGTIASFLDLEPRDGLYTMATEGTDPDETFVSQSLCQMSSGLSVLTAPSRPLPLESIRPEQIASLLKILQAQHDYVVVDLPRTLVRWVGPVLDACDRLLLVTDMTVPTIRQARRLLDIYEEDNLALPVEIVVNGERKPLVKGRHHREAAQLLGRPLAHWLPHHPKSARLAIDRGMTLADIAPRSPLQKSIAALTASLSADLSGNSKTKTVK